MPRLLASLLVLPAADAGGSVFWRQGERKVGVLGWLRFGAQPLPFVNLLEDESFRRLGLGQGRDVFLVAAAGDVDGDGAAEILVAFTLKGGRCGVVVCSAAGGWLRQRWVIDLSGAEISFVRCIATGDLDGDGRDEILLGTRPNGCVLLLSLDGSAWRRTVLERAAYGAGTTNVREVCLARLPGLAGQQALAAVARASPRPRDAGKDLAQWERTPGCLCLYQGLPDAPRRSVLDDHGGRTHARALLAADLDADGYDELVSVPVGVLAWPDHRMEFLPEVVFTRCEASLEGEARTRRQASFPIADAIKARGLDAGDIGGDGAMNLFLGTRNLPGGSSRLLSIGLDKSLQPIGSEVLAESGPLGFHCVKLGDFDGDGTPEIVASDDGQGRILELRRSGSLWQQRVLLDAGARIFVTGLVPFPGPAPGGVE
jgi:hypothetical protein